MNTRIPAGSHAADTGHQANSQNSGRQKLPLQRVLSPLLALLLAFTLLPQTAFAFADSPEDTTVANSEPGQTDDAVIAADEEALVDDTSATESELQLRAEPFAVSTTDIAPAVTFSAVNIESFSAQTNAKITAIANNSDATVASATVNATSGVVTVTGLKAGNTTLTLNASSDGGALSETVAVTVTGVYDLNQLTLTGLQSSYSYAGKPISPTFTLSKRSAALAVDTDYTFSWSDNTAPGTATLTLTGQGVYAGSSTRIININIESEPALYLTGYRLWDSSFDANNGFAEITRTLDPTALVGDNGTGGGVSTQNLALTFNLPVAIANADDLLTQINITYKNANKDTTVTVDPANPNTIIFKMRDKPGVTTAQAGSALAVSPVAASRFLDSLVAADDAGIKAYLPYDIATTQPTGIILEQVSATVGTSTTPASVTYQISGIPLVRSMNFLRFEANGVAVGQTSGYFTIHSHTFYSMDAATHVASLNTAAASALNTAGYTFTNNSDGSFTVTAQSALEGEQLSWQTWAYPNRSVSDNKQVLSDALSAAPHAPALIKQAARLVLLDAFATAAEIQAAKTSLVAYESLYEAIVAANKVEVGIVISVDGSDVPTTEYWVTPAAAAALTQALAEAGAVFSSGASGSLRTLDDALRVLSVATAGQVDSARISLDGAVQTYTASIKPGTKQASAASGGLPTTGDSAGWLWAVGLFALFGLVALLVRRGRKEVSVQR